jgi:hypothetical protein
VPPIVPVQVDHPHAWELAAIRERLARTPQPSRLVQRDLILYRWFCRIGIAVTDKTVGYATAAAATRIRPLFTVATRRGDEVSAGRWRPGSAKARTRRANG